MRGLPVSCSLLSKTSYNQLAIIFGVQRLKAQTENLATKTERERERVRERGRERESERGAGKG